MLATVDLHWLRLAEAGEERALADLLSADERARVAERAPGHRLRATASRAFLRTLLGERTGVAPAAVELARRRDGKPELVRGGPHFSVSHSGDAILVAMTDAGPVGVDVEALRPVRHAVAIAGRRLGPAVADAVRHATGDERDAVFLEEWCRAESLVKATGQGVAGMRTRDEHAWDTIALALEPGWVGALSVPRR